MRKLASIQRIREITPIKDADRIELAHILGWQCVVKKGEFSEGDLCVYFEIDSFLPIEEKYEFLRNSSYKNSELLGEGFRLKTQKMRGEISQGLALPISLFPEIGDKSEGEDVTDILGVKKWEIPEMATTGGTVIGQLPYSVPHTDEVRIQNAPELIQEFAGKDYYISTKMDGSSHSMSVDKNGFHATGHNYEYKDDGTSSFYEHLKQHGYDKTLVDIYNAEGYDEITVQGEFCAPGIQKNRLKLTAPEWYVFTVIVDGKRLSLDEQLSFCEKLGFEHVPIEEKGDNLPNKYPTVETLLERAQGEYPRGGNKEGIVIRPVTPIYSEVINAPLSVKIINNKYLLK